MKLAILDSNFTETRYASMAATWLRWELEKRKVSESLLLDADIILATVSSQQGLSNLRGGLKRIKNKKAKVIIGGGGAYAPAVFDSIADVCCVGEGKRFIDTLLSDGYDAVLELPEAWIPEDTRPVIPAKEFPWDCPPVCHPDGTIRVFGSRGCKYRCLFCQTGWENSYRPHPSPDFLQAQIELLGKSGQRINIVSNDVATEKIRLATVKVDSVSARLQNLAKLMPLSRKNVGTVRIGVEGVSERLRVAVGKPVSHDKLLDTTYSLLENGIGTTWFFVVGLPGETDADYIELRQLVMELHKLSKGCVMANFHSFIPQPATPLCIFPLKDEYWERFDEFRRWFFHGPGFTRHFQIVSPNKYPSRLRRAMQSMAATEEELRRGWWKHDNRNWRVKYLASPEKMRHIARIYANKIGLS